MRQTKRFLKLYVASHITTIYSTTMGQLKGNLMPARVLQVEYCRVKITLCIQHLNVHPLRLCPHHASCQRHVHPQTLLILNELFNETNNINSIHTVNLLILSLYIPVVPSIYCPTEKLLTCSILHALLFG